MIDSARPHTITTAAPTHIKSQFALDPIENREERCCFLRFPDKCSFAVRRDSLDGGPSSFSLDAYFSSNFVMDMNSIFSILHFVHL